MKRTSLLRRTPLKQGDKPLKRSPLRNRATANGINTPKRAVSPASNAQREKVKGRACVFTADDTAVDPAHLWPRSLGGCDDALCVVPLRRDAHRAFDDGELDLLPSLISAGCFEEMAHVIAAHRVSPLTLLRRLTGREWIEVDRLTGERY